MKKVYYVVAIILAFASCERFNYDIRVDEDFIKELKAKAEPVISIGAQEYFLDAYLWRDFMPVSPPGGKPLISINWVISRDSTPIPANVKLVKQYVIKADSVWIADYEPGASERDYKIEGISRNGPKWGPHIEVDIVAKITDTNTKTDYFLKKENVVISRTD